MFTTFWECEQLVLGSSNTLSYEDRIVQKITK